MISTKNIRGLFFLFLLFSVQSALLSQAPAYEQLPFSKGLNSSFDEQLPVFSPDGNTLYVTRSNHPGNVGGISDKGDIWVSKKLSNGSWSEAKNLGRPLNDRFVNVAIGFSFDGTKMYLKNFYINDHNSLVSKGISISNMTSSGWSYPKNVSIDYFENNSSHQSMSVSSDGKILLMGIESFGSYGGEDIYVSFKKPDGNWTEPKNLGKKINTKLQEVTPYLAPDNKTLYFSSNGHGGHGSMDVFVSKRLDETWKNWSIPKNLGKGINTSGTESSYQFIPGTKEAIVISTQNSDGYGDVKRLKLKEEQIAETQLETSRSLEVDETPKVSLELLVIDGSTKDPIESTIELIRDEILVDTYKTGFSGALSIMVEPGKYEIEISSKSHLVEIIKMDIYKKLKETIELLPVEVGSTVQMSNVLFETSTANLIGTSFNELDKVVAYMEKNPDVRIKLSGHTDNRGDYYLNIKLSEDRVKAVKRYLVTKGVSEKRIEGEGFGGKVPIADNSKEETRRLNRRVEFTILEK